MEKEYEILLSEAILIEKQIFKNQKIDEYKDYYHFLKENSKLFEDVYTSLNKISSKKILKYSDKIREEIPEKIDFNNFKIIKSKKNLINFLLSLLILKIFSKNSLYDVKKENNLHHFYSIRNSLSQKFENILIFLEISLNFKNEIDLNKLGKQLKFNKRSSLLKPLSEKEKFIDLVTQLENNWNSSNELYEKFKINLVEYEENFFSLIEDLISLHFGDWKTEIILWYVYGRMDDEGNLYSLMVSSKHKKEKEEVIIDTPTQLWDFIVRLEKEKQNKK
jgi:hypothetical protein